MSIINDFENGLHLLEATAEQMASRLATLGDKGTAGPDEHPLEHQLDASKVNADVPISPAWTDGWWASAMRRPAHAGRVGGQIAPWATVVHTTDMVPEDWPALLYAIESRPGDGACFTFAIGRTPADGVVQCVPVTRNANHAGGPQHGVFDTAAARDIHPNLVTVGIELHCAGGLRFMAGAWRFVEGGAVHGAPIPASDVIVDPKRPGRGWHIVTDYQREQLAKLLGDLSAVLQPPPSGAVARSRGEKPQPFVVMSSARVVTHAELDPTNRADPWKPTCEWLRGQGL